MLCCVCWIVCVGWSALKCKMCLVVDQVSFCIGFCIDFAMGSLGCCDSAISLLDWLQSCFAQFLRVQWELDMSHWNALPCLLNYTCKQTHNWHRLKIRFFKQWGDPREISILKFKLEGEILYYDPAVYEVFKTNLLYKNRGQKWRFRENSTSVLRCRWQPARSLSKPF